MATHVGASRTPQEVMEHYTSRWLSSSSWATCLCGTTTRSSTTRTPRRSSPGSWSTTTTRRGDRAEARARAHVRAQGPRAAVEQEHRARLQPGARLPGQGQGERAGGAMQGHQGEGAAPEAAASVPVHVVQGVRRPIRENAQGEAAALPAQRHHKDGGVGRVRGGPAQAREVQGEQGGGGGGRQARQGGRPGWRVRGHRAPSGLRALVDREKVMCNSLNLSPARYVTVKTIIIKDHLQKRRGIPSKSRLPSCLDKVLRK
uniref:Uncharacterized protein n=1 Tax=Bos indicus x Bos taurus TaxID=30522 RepID=A0A4W2FRA9_BOBOX